MSHHTPGPWRVIKGHHLSIEPYGEKGPVVAFTAWAGKDAGQDLADARLIAQAPEMYVKLARALVALSKYDYGLADSISLDVFETWQEIDRVAKGEG